MENQVEQVEQVEPVEPAASKGQELLSQEEVGALFDAVRDSADAGSAGAGGGARPFVPRLLEAKPDDLDALLRRVQSSLAQELPVALGAVLKTRVALSLDAPLLAPAAVSLGDDEVVIDIGADGDRAFLSLHVAGVGLRLFADRLLGGPGQVDGDVRSPTDLERRMASRALDGLAAAAMTALRPYVEHRLQASVRYEAAAGPSPEPRLTATARFALCDHAVDAIIEYAGDALARAVSGPVAAVSGRTLADSLDGVPMRTALRTGGFSIPVLDLLDLQPGQVLSLGRGSDVQIDVLVEGRARFRGRLEVTEEGRQVAVTEQISGASRHASSPPNEPSPAAEPHVATAPREALATA